jgi:hypothetical protein
LCGFLRRLAGGGHVSTAHSITELKTLYSFDSIRFSMLRNVFNVARAHAATYTAGGIPLFEVSMFRLAIPLLAALCVTPVFSSSISIYAAANSQIDQSNPETIWSDWGTLIIQYYQTGHEVSDIFRFDLAAVPSGATITGAKLWLFDTGWDDMSPQFVYWHPDSSWDPSTVNWNTFPMGSNQLVGSLNGVPGGRYDAWNIDLAAWDWAADVAQGAATFQLRMGYGFDSFNQNDFISLGNRQNLNYPYLELEYAGGSSGAPEPGTLALLGAGLVLVAVGAARTRTGR